MTPKEIAEKAGITEKEVWEAVFSADIATMPGLPLSRYLTTMSGAAAYAWQLEREEMARETQKDMI